MADNDDFVATTASYISALDDGQRVFIPATARRRRPNRDQRGASQVR